MIRLCSLGVIALLSVGCSSSDVAVRYYQLADDPVSSTISSVSRQLVIEPVVLVDYLKRPNILLKQKSNNLYITKYHVWAEPLDKAIARTMVNHLNKQQSNIRVDNGLFARCVDNEKCFRLTLLVEDFYPTDNSLAKFSGKYQIVRNGKIIVQQDFNLRNDLNEDGYQHAVLRLQDLIYQLSSQIEQQLPR